MGFIAKIIRSMREFQEKNGIKKQCVTNVQYLYDCIKINHSSANVKVKALMVISTDNDAETCTCVSGHLAIILVDDETLIEPSYDVFSLKNKSYFDNIKDLMDSFDDKDSLKKKFDIKKIVLDHIYFMKLAEQINNGELTIADKKFYNDQADYIENLY